MQSPFDVIVVGSGASGGWAAKRLSEAGVKVALVDCGRVQADAAFSEHKPAFSLKYRDRAPDVIRRTRPVQKDCYACMEYNYDWFANDLDEPYVTPEGKPFSWLGRLRVTGGRTNVWGRQSYRLSDLDFKSKSYDGYGEDWPISYKDVEPYYDIVEDYVGISGQAEGISELPDSRFLPPMPMTCAETQLKTRLKAALGRTVTIGRAANLTRPVNGRGECHYCGPCERGCVTHSYFNAAFTTVADALKSGNCTLIPNAMVHRVLMDAGANRATGVLYIDRNTRDAKEVHAKAVVLCAQSLESVRILLNSATREHAAGLANSSGTLGHYLMDHHAGSGAVGEFGSIKETPGIGGPQRPNGIYIIRFRNTNAETRRTDYLRGFGYQGWGGVGLNFEAPGFGQEYKNAIRQISSPWLTLAGFGECLARFENFVEIDPGGTVDAFGIPVLKIHMTWCDNERAMMKDMAGSAVEMLKAAGATQVFPTLTENPVPGYGIHEAGIARMGSDPKTSVLNAFCQSHDVRNLFVMDASAFVSIACQNPTLTIMALAVRSSDYLKEALRRGEL
jgi:choline dehydrogenase-like flavoprotein